MLLGVLLLLFATPLLASGNHLRKRLHELRLPGRLAGLGGLALLCGFALPVYDGETLVQHFLRGRAWEAERLDGTLCLLAFLAYGVLGVIGFARGRQRGFTFVGSTIVYAHMQAVGMVNDHLVACFRHGEVRRQG